MFKKLNKCFDEPQSRWLSGPSYAGVPSAEGLLPVRACGSYEYTLVPQHSDFDRVNPSVFSLDNSVRDVLRQEYPAGFAFLVCKIKGSRKFHPVAYKHPMREDNKLFVPTLHFHQGHGPAEEGHHDWDHDIYLVMERPLGRQATELQTLRDMTALRATLPDVYPNTLKKLEINGRFPNNDLLVPVEG